jgi:hypothetical protein
MPPIIPGIAAWLWQAGLTQDQWNKYQTTTEEQIREGRSTREAHTRALMALIENNPHTQQAQFILQNLYQTMPQEVEKSRREFLGDYDTRMAGVTGLLDEYGTQALKDVRTTFGEAKGAAMNRLVEQGLTGGGVASSIGQGFATREAAALARAREEAALVKSNQLYQIEAGRAGYDAALRGDVYNTKIGLGQGLADFQQGWGQTGNEAFADAGNRTIEEIYGVQNVPPDMQGVNQLASTVFSRGRA